MNVKLYRKYFWLISLTIALSMMLAACGVGSAPETAPAEVEPQEEVSESEVAETETEVDQTAEETSEETIDQAAETLAEAQESEAVKAEAVEGGTTVITDEPDVSTPRTKLGGEHRTVETSDAVSFHPYTTTDVPSRDYQGLVYSSELLTIDEHTLEYIPHMAESYSVSEDGLTFTFNLRQDMQWSDDQPITAQDFKWTYDQVTNPENEFPYLSQFDFISSYEAIDDFTIQVTIEEIYAPALGQMSGLIFPLPKHIWENLDWSDPEQNPEINNPSVVSGPYKLSEWRRDQFVIFEANENYWYYGSPNIQSRIIEIVPDQDIAFEKLKQSDTDTMGTMPPEQWLEARELEDVTVHEWWPAAALWTYMGLNMREGHPTHDINVRHGLNYAIDKQLLTEEVYFGLAKRMCGPYPETSWVYNPDIPCYEYDPDKALEEFAEAGYTFQDGKMVDENGDQLTLRLIYGPTTSRTAELIAVTVQDYLADIGVNVEIRALEWSSFLETKNNAEPDWDIFIGAWRSTIEPHVMFSIWAEENIPDLNSVGYVNKEVAALFDEAGATYDIDFRTEKYGEIQRIIATESPYIFLYYRKDASAQNNRIQGLEPTSLGIDWNIPDWYVEEPID